MKDEVLEGASEQGTVSVSRVSSHEPVQPRKSKSKIWFLIALAGSFVLFVACLVLVGVSLYRARTEKRPIESVLDNYMRYMANREVESAYALFSPRAQRLVPISELEKLIEGKNYLLFEGYKSLSLSNLSISVSANTNPDVPQGIVARATGTVLFEGNIQGAFNAILEKVDGTWMIYGMHVTVPPEKIE